MIETTMIVLRMLRAFAVIYDIVGLTLLVVHQLALVLG